MADTQSVVSDVKLFIERLKKELPEVFGQADGNKNNAEAAHSGDNKVLYNGKLYEARMYLTPDQEEGVAFDGTFFIFICSPRTQTRLLWLPRGCGTKPTKP